MYTVVLLNCNYIKLHMLKKWTVTASNGTPTCLLFRTYHPRSALAQCACRFSRYNVNWNYTVVMNSHLFTICGDDDIWCAYFCDLMTQVTWKSEKLQLCRYIYRTFGFQLLMHAILMHARRWWRPLFLKALMNAYVVWPVEIPVAVTQIIITKRQLSICFDKNFHVLYVVHTGKILQNIV